MAKTRRKRTVNANDAEAARSGDPEVSSDRGPLDAGPTVATGSPPDSPKKAAPFPDATFIQEVTNADGETLKVVEIPASTHGAMSEGYRAELIKSAGIDLGQMVESFDPRKNVYRYAPATDEGKDATAPPTVELLMALSTAHGAPKTRDKALTDAGFDLGREIEELQVPPNGVRFVQVIQGGGA